MDDRQVQLRVVGVRMELPSNQPVLILRGLRDADQYLHLAVVVGPAEAAAVARALQGEVPPRPMTHDLLLSALEELAGGVKSVEIGLLDPSTYYGTIVLPGGKTLDARASDAVAVAVRAQCPITMAFQTLREVSVTPRYTTSSHEAPGGDPAGMHEASDEQRRRGPISEEEIEQFQKFLSDAGPEDFDKS